ncbi:MAG: phosphatase PAP2 family protein [Candidatus Saccharibacteria bacterium]|nr:phosphatase PAP2 family protein [Candidatus Saccharibacteria bacterium]
MDWIIKLVADGMVVPVALIGAYTLLRFVPHQQKYQVYARVVMAGLTAYVAAKIAGVLYQPSGLRPFELLGVEAGASFLNNPGFPSDHALFVTAITLAVAFGARQPKWALIAAVLSLLVCLGRVLALVHTPLDVVGGVLIACVGVVWYVPLKRKQHSK